MAIVNWPASCCKWAVLCMHASARNHNISALYRKVDVEITEPTSACSICVELHDIDGPMLPQLAIAMMSPEIGFSCLRTATTGPSDRGVRRNGTHICMPLLDRRSHQLVLHCTALGWAGRGCAGGWRTAVTSNVAAYCTDMWGTADQLIDRACNCKGQKGVSAGHWAWERIE